MTKKLIWRLSKLPNPEEVRELVKDKIITHEEARDILFSSETEKERDEKSLKSEIEFLRELVDKLSSSRDRTIEVIKQVQVPYHKYPWYPQYEVWCNNVSSIYGNAGTNTSYITTSGTTSFSSIKTF